MSKSLNQGPVKRKLINTNFLGKYPGRTLHRIGVCILGFWLAGNSLKIIWPEQDQVSIYSKTTRSEFIAERIRKSGLNILVLIVDNTDRKNIDFREIKNSFFILLHNKKPIKILTIPNQFKIISNKKSYLLSRIDLYNLGGISLFYNMFIKDFSNISTSNNRYLIISNSNVNRFINDLGNLPLSKINQNVL